QSSAETNNSSNEGSEKYVISPPKNNKQKAKAPILPYHDQYPWIFYDINKNRIFCMLCMTHGQKNEFAKANKGSKNFKINTLFEYASIKQYEKAFQLKGQKKGNENCYKMLYIETSNDNSSMYNIYTTSLEMLDALVQIIEDKIWQDLVTCSAFRIMLNESTDIATESHVILYVKYYLHWMIKV
ncbi:6721_t:CDS:2, partial [Funneliformis caledonium]